MYTELKNKVIAAAEKFAAAGKAFPRDGFISVRDKKLGCYAIKHVDAGIKDLTEKDVIILDNNGNVIEGDKEGFDPRFNTHLVIYNANKKINVIAQPESRWNNIWAMTGITLAPASLMHARYFFGEILMTECISFDVGEDYFTAAGEAVAERLKYKGIRDDGAIFVRNNTGIVWGTNLKNTVSRAVALEEICFRAYHARLATGSKVSYISAETNEYFYNK